MMNLFFRQYGTPNFHRNVFNYHHIFCNYGETSTSYHFNGVNFFHTILLPSDLVSYSSTWKTVSSKHFFNFTVLMLQFTLYFFIF